MRKLHELPQPLLRQVILTAASGIGCLLVGGTAGAVMRDHILLLLTALATLLCLLKSIELYHMAAKEKFLRCEGVCTSIDTTGILRRQRKITLCGDDGKETVFRLERKIRPQVGRRYRIYFKPPEYAAQHNTWLEDSMLSGGLILGMEVI